MSLDSRSVPAAAAAAGSAAPRRSVSDSQSHPPAQTSAAPQTAQQSVCIFIKLSPHFGMTLRPAAATFGPRRSSYSPAAGTARGGIEVAKSFTKRWLSCRPHRVRRRRRKTMSIGIERRRHEHPHYEEEFEFSEGPVARAIERRTARLPSDLFLWAAIGSICGSLVLQTRKEKQLALFVGQWAPTFLLLGIYNKLVKIAGSDRYELEEEESYGEE
jgi:hypothetical protein